MRNNKTSGKKRTWGRAVAGVIAFILVFSRLPFEGYAAAEGKLEQVYVDGTAGSDENGGSTEQDAVASYFKAKELLADGGSILVSGTITVYGEAAMSYTSLSPASGFTGALIYVAETGVLTLEGMSFAGAQTAVLNSGTVILPDGSGRDFITLQENGRVITSPDESEDAADETAEWSDESLEETEEIVPESQEETSAEQEETETEAEETPDETENEESPEETETEAVKDKDKKDKDSKDKEQNNQSSEDKMKETDSKESSEEAENDSADQFESESGHETQPVESDQNGQTEEEQSESSKESEQPWETEETTLSEEALEAVYALMALPKEVKNISDVMKIADTYKTVQSLSSKGRKEISAETLELLEEALTKVSAYNKSCNGVVVEGELPWNIQLRATLKSTSAYAAKAEVDQVILPYEIKLWDVIENQEYQLAVNEQVKITMPVPGVANYTDIVVVHYLEDGRIEYIKPAINNETISFYTSSFSPFDVAGSVNQLVPGVTPGNSTGNAADGGTTGGNTGNAAPGGTGSGSAGNNTGSTGSNTGATGTNNNSTGNNNSNASGNTYSSVNTGDSAGKAIIAFGIVSVVALILVIGLVVSKKRKKDSDEE